MANALQQQVVLQKGKQAEANPEAAIILISWATRTDHMNELSDGIF